MSDLKDTFDAAEQLLNELQWYADRGIDLSEPPDGPALNSWADMMRDELDELRGYLAKIRAAANGEGGR